MAIAALVLGIIGTIFSLIPVIGAVVAIPVGVIALILGIVARKNAKANNMPTGSATAGMALGIVSVALGILLYVACTVCANAAMKQINEAQKNNPEWKKAMETVEEHPKAAEQPAK